jgi:cytochrome c-type biogenesis protein CcmH
VSRLDRRAFVAAAGALVLPAVLRARQHPTDTTQARPSAEGDAGFLPAPALAGVSRPAVTAMDNDPTVIAIEHRVRCPCPCGLDVYTCRTTDFTCSYSPERHKEIMALVGRGMTADQVVADLVARYGEATLMAPKPRGFNLFGYLVPGTLVLLLGAAITSVILSRRRGTAPVPVRASGAAGNPPGVSADEMARLERAMRELES